MTTEPNNLADAFPLTAEERAACKALDAAIEQALALEHVEQADDLMEVRGDLTRFVRWYQTRAS